MSTRYLAADGRVGPLSTTVFTVTAAVPVVPLAPTFTVDTAAGLYFPIVSGTDAVPDAAITVWIDGVMVATADADASGTWATSAISQLAVGGHQLAATQTSNGLTSPASSDQSFTLLSPTIVSPTADTVIPLFTDLTLQISGLAGSPLTAVFSTTKDSEAPIVTQRDILLDVDGAATETFAYTLREYWQQGSMTVYYTDGTRVGPSSVLDIVRKLN